MVGIDHLPAEVLEHILLRLSLRDLFMIQDAAASNLLPQLWGKVADTRLEQVSHCLVDCWGEAAYYCGAALGL